MEDLLSLALEPSRSIRHHSLPLRGSNSSTEVGLAGLAELALLALCDKEENRTEGVSRASVRRKQGGG